MSCSSDAHDLGDALAGPAVGEHERLAVAHQRRVALHDLEAGADVRREVGLVDDQDVRLRDARAVLARDLVAGGDVDDVDEVVDEGRAEGQRQVVAAALDEHHVGVREPRLHVLHGGEVHARVLAHGGVRAGAGLDAQDAVLDEHALERPLDVLGVLGRDHVVGHDQHLGAEVDEPRRDAPRRARSCPSRRGRRCRSGSSSSRGSPSAHEQAHVRPTWTAARMSVIGANVGHVVERGVRDRGVGVRGASRRPRTGSPGCRGGRPASAAAPRSGS